MTQDLIFTPIKPMYEKMLFKKFQEASLKPHYMASITDLACHQKYNLYKTYDVAMYFTEIVNNWG